MLYGELELLTDSLLYTFYIEITPYYRFLPKSRFSVRVTHMPKRVGKKWAASRCLPSHYHNSFVHRTAERELEECAKQKAKTTSAWKTVTAWKHNTAEHLCVCTECERKEFTREDTTHEFRCQWDMHNDGFLLPCIASNCSTLTNSALEKTNVSSHLKSSAQSSVEKLCLLCSHTGAEKE